MDLILGKCELIILLVDISDLSFKFLKSVPIPVMETILYWRYSLSSLYEDVSKEMPTGRRRV